MFVGDLCWSLFDIHYFVSFLVLKEKMHLGDITLFDLEIDLRVKVKVLPNTLYIM